MDTKQNSSSLSRRQALLGATAVAALTAAPVAVKAADVAGPCERLYHRFAAAWDRSLNLPSQEQVALAIVGDQPRETWGELTRPTDGSKFFGPLGPDQIRERYTGAERDRLLAIRNRWWEAFNAARNAPEAQAADPEELGAHDEAYELLGKLLETPAATLRELAFKFLAYAAFTEWCDLDEDELTGMKLEAARLVGVGVLPDVSVERHAALLRQCLARAT